MKPKCCSNQKALTEITQTAELLKIIAEPNRLKILCALKNDELCVCEIWQDLDIPQNLASHHLKIMRDAGLLDSRKEGLKIIYSLNKKGIKNLTNLLNNFLKPYAK